MRDGNLADHRLTPGLVINVLRQAMNIWAVTRLFSLAQTLCLNIRRCRNNRERKNNFC
jgi:hypothetical protein